MRCVDCARARAKSARRSARCHDRILVPCRNSPPGRISARHFTSRAHCLESGRLQAAAWMTSSPRECRMALEKGSPFVSSRVSFAGAPRASEATNGRESMPRSSGHSKEYCLHTEGGWPVSLCEQHTANGSRRAIPIIIRHTQTHALELATERSAELAGCLLCELATLPQRLS